MYTREELEKLIAECDANAKSITEQAQQEDQRLRNEFEQAKARFEQGVAQLNAVVNNKAGQEEGAKLVYQKMLATLPLKDDAGQPANEYPEEVILSKSNGAHAPITE